MSASIVRSADPACRDRGAVGSLRRALALAVALCALTPAAPGASSTKLQIDATELPRKKFPQLSYKDVVDKVAPAVVNIYSTKTVRTSDRAMGMFQDPFFQRFFGLPPGAQVPRERQEQSLGSGVIVTRDGYIITNSHVVEGADSIRVALPGSGRELDAKVVGTDPQTDIAVVKVEDADLPAATLGDSDKLAVGDVVLAVGNPFNVGQTVTIGIAGAVGRGNIGIETYEDFIQTDASINPGNSGGPLIDGLGRVVGINTAILSRTGGNQGVGFAVPINLTRHVFDQIVAHGSVTRGYLGVVAQPVTSELAEAFGLEQNQGALIADVSPGTPAEQAGLQPGDVVVGFDGTDLRDSRHLQLQVAQKQPGEKITLRVLRDGKPVSITATLGEQPQEARAGSSGPGSSSQGGESLLSGMEVQDVTPQIRSQIGLPEGMNGAVISAVAPDSPGAQAGLQPGDVILGIDRQPVTSAADAARLGNAATDDRVLLRVWSRGGIAFVLLKRPDAP